MDHGNSKESDAKIFVVFFSVCFQIIANSMFIITHC